MKPIPVLGTMIYNRPDYLLRMLRSVDYPVEKVVVVLNYVTQEIAEAADVIRGMFPHVVIHNPGDNQPAPVNLGFSGGWNWMLKNHMAEWLLVVGNDVQFMPGELEKLTAYYERHKNLSPPMAVVNTSMGWNIHGITKHGLDVMGFLDENFYPCYYDDTDMDYRHTLAQRKKLVSYPEQGEFHIHAHHEGSATVKNLPPDKAERMGQAFTRNIEYYIRKWGGPQCQEKWERPFNDPSKSIKEWTLEPGRWEMNKLQ